MKRQYYMIAVIAFLLTAVISFNAGSAAHSVTSASAPSTAERPVVFSPDIYSLWLDTNTERQKVGETPLVLDTRLTTSATAKCHDMAVKNYWNHDAPDGTPWYSFIQQATPYRQAGENLAQGYDTADETTAGWMNSPEHKANILNARFTNVGYAVCQLPSHMNTVVQQFTAL